MRCFTQEISKRTTSFSCVSHLQIRAKVLGDVGAITLTEDCDLLLNVLNLILGLLQVDDLDSNDALCTIVDTFEHLSEEEEETWVGGKEKTLGACLNDSVGERENALIMKN